MNLGNLVLIDHNIRMVTIVDPVHNEKIIMNNILPYDEDNVLKEWRGLDIQKISIVNGVITVVPTGSGWAYYFGQYVRAHKRAIEYSSVVSALKRCGLQNSIAAQNAIESRDYWEKEEREWMDDMEKSIPGSVTGTHIGKGEPYET